MDRAMFVEKYGWEIIDQAIDHQFFSHDFPGLNRVATTTEVILWNELVHSRNEPLQLLRRVMNRIHEGGSIWQSPERRHAYELVAKIASNLRAAERTA